MFAGTDGLHGIASSGGRKRGLRQDPRAVVVVHADEIERVRPLVVMLDRAGPDEARVEVADRERVEEREVVRVIDARRGAAICSGVSSIASHTTELCAKLTRAFGRTDLIAWYASAWTRSCSHDADRGRRRP